MKTFSASWIFPISSPPIKNGVITADDDGKILDIAVSELPTPSPKLNGIIIPGFINTHCHLELSHLKGKINEGTGMAGFISELVPLRNKFTGEEIQNAIAEAEAEMIANGIVAVGDICNTPDSFGQKSKRNLFYHTFIEIFDLDPEKASEVLEKAKKLQGELNFSLQPHLPTHEGSKSVSGSNSSIAPHAPYTVSPDLFMLIAELKQELICIHNQESKAENELFVKKSGALMDLFMQMGNHLDWLEETGKNSIRSSLPYLLQHKKIMLVHNTFTSKKDLAWAQSFISNPVPGNEKMQLYWCTCPNANLYIENKLPDYNMFMEQHAKMTLGTDSYASNWSLSILDELKTIVKHFPKISLEKLLKWATLNGAECLGIEKSYGSIEKGKKPGLVLLENCDGIRITDKTNVKKLF